MLVFFILMLALQGAAWFWLFAEDKLEIASAFLFVASVSFTATCLSLQLKEYNCERENNVYSCSIEIVPTMGEPNE